MVCLRSRAYKIIGKQGFLLGSLTEEQALLSTCYPANYRGKDAGLSIFLKTKVALCNNSDFFFFEAHYLQF